VSGATPIDAAALAKARERLEGDLFVLAPVVHRRDDGAFETCYVECADLRIVLDALKEARRQAFEEMATELRYRLAWRFGGDTQTIENCVGLVTGTAEALARKEQS